MSICKVCGYDVLDNAPNCWECGYQIRTLSVFEDLPKQETSSYIKVITAKNASATRQIILRRNSLTLIKNNRALNFHLEQIIREVTLDEGGGLFSSWSDVSVRVWKTPRINNYNETHRIRFASSQTKELRAFLRRINIALESLQDVRKENKRAMIADALAGKAKIREAARDYDSAIEIWEDLGEIYEAARVRK